MKIYKLLKKKNGALDQSSSKKQPINKYYAVDDAIS